MNKIKVAIANDDDKLRKSLVLLLHTYADITVMLQAHNGKDLIEQLQTIRPDIILMDISMPEMGGVEATIKVKKLYPEQKIIAYSIYNFEANIIEMYAHGVKSFIGKDDKPDELVRAIRTVHSGGAYMTNYCGDIIQRNLSYLNPTKHSINLTEYELNLLRAICKGDSSTKIGSSLSLSSRTIEEHRTNLYKKFGVRTKEELISIAIRSNFF